MCITDVLLMYVLLMYVSEKLLFQTQGDTKMCKKSHPYITMMKKHNGVIYTHIRIKLKANRWINLIRLRGHTVSDSSIVLYDHN